MGDLSLSLFIFFDAARVDTMCLSRWVLAKKATCRRSHVDLIPCSLFFSLVGKLQCAKREKEKYSPEKPNVEIFRHFHCFPFVVCRCSSESRAFPRSFKPFVLLSTPYNCYYQFQFSSVACENAFCSAHTTLCVLRPGR